MSEEQVASKMDVLIGEEEPQLPRFYAGRDIFITGASGFVGKVLVERLLSTCPGVGRLHLLLRARRDHAPRQRLAQIKLSPVFSKLKQTNPGQLDKLRLVAGDLTAPELGISSEAMEQLTAVSVVFHSAATVRFNEELPRAIDQNVLSVQRLLAVCDKLPALKVLVHVSTGYSQAERALVPEAVAPLPHPLPRLLRHALAQTRLTPRQTKRFISPKPNTYTYTKMLAESVVQQHHNSNYARAIFRPTIVISSLRNPFPGWLENHSGATGFVVGVLRGTLHVSGGKGSARADLLPVDMAADTLLAAAWDVFTYGDRRGSAAVYNCSSCAAPTTWAEFRREVVRAARAAPSSRALAYPFYGFVHNRFLYKVLEVLLQTWPLYFAEYVYQLFNGSQNQNRVSFKTAADRLRAMNDVLEYFPNRDWEFRTGNTERLRTRLSAADARLYTTDPTLIDWKETYKNYVLGCRRHLFGEPDATIPAARVRMRRIHLVHQGVTFLVSLLLALLLRAALPRTTFSFAIICSLIAVYLL